MIALVAAIALALVAPAAGAAVAPEACAADGGMAICSAPVVVPANSALPADGEGWQYALCDNQAAYLGRIRVWCEVQGGTWVVVSYGKWRCDGAVPPLDPQIVPYAREFERRIANACTIGNTDTGWGASVQSYQCASGSTVYSNGIATTEHRQLDFSGLRPDSLGNCVLPWAETVFASRRRTLACPSGYSGRLKTNGDLECWYLPVACDPRVCGKTGNPIGVILGNKTQEELDYRSAAIGGLELVRHYNSLGFLAVEPRAPRAHDYWRTNWDRRVVAVTGSTYVLAYAQRANGAVKAFRTDGTELHNTSGGSDVLERLDGGDASGGGWRLATGTGDVETYDANGRMRKVVTGAGHQYVLGYGDDGNLATVTDVHGRALSLGYDAAGRLVSVGLPDLSVLTYGYSAGGNLERVVREDGSVRRYVYENPAFPHALTGIVDENGDRFATWTYDEIGRAITSQHAGGAERVVLTLTSSRQTTGINKVTDALGATRTHSFQLQGGVLRLTSQTQSCNGCPASGRSYAYDANGNLAAQTDFNGNRTTYAYDLARNVEVSRTEAAGTPLARTTTTQWHPVFRLPVRVTAPSPVDGVPVVTSFVYDAQGRVASKTVTGPRNDGSGGSASRTWTWTWSTNERMASATDPNGNTTTYAYYADDDPVIARRGNLAAVTNALGHVRRILAYDANGRPLSLQDANDVVTSLAYDARGRLASRIVGAERTEYAYDPVGQLTGVTLPDGSTLAYAYDAAHRLVEIADGLGNRIAYTLDAMDHRLREDVYDPTGNLARTRSRAFDPLGRLAGELGAAGQGTAHRYDAAGNRVATVDPLARETGNAYDALNRLWRVTDPAGGTTRYGYDAAGNLAQVTDPRGLATVQAYDGLGNLVRQSSPDTGVTTHAYDAAGNVVLRIDARGVAASSSFDALDRLVRTEYSMAGAPAEAHAFEYDGGANGAPNATGRLTKVVDPAATTRWDYSAAGRVAVKSQQAGGVTLATTYEYDPAGQRIRMGTPSGQAIAYGYRNNRVASIAVNGVALISSVAGEPFGPPGAWQWGNGLFTFRDYDADGRIRGWELHNGASILRNDIAWDAADRITRIVDPANPAREAAYQYDALDRLTLAQRGNPVAATQQFGYDAVGNRTSVTVDGALANLTHGASSNRLVEISGSVAHDPLHGEAGRTYAYNLANRLVQVVNGSGSATTYEVNALGQRVAKDAGGIVTRFVYDEDGRLLGEYDAAGRLIQETIWLADLPVATLRPKPGSTTIPVQVEIFYVHADHLGSPRVVTRPAENALMWRWDNADPFGANAANENPAGKGAFVYNLRFPGQYYDAESGTHYNYFRDYDPTIGRYVESDPIGLKGGINTYSYGDNTPASNKDALGLATYMCRQPLQGCRSTGNQRCFADVAGNPFYHQYLCVIEPNGNITCGGQDRTGNPLSSRGKPSDDSYPINRPDMCERKDPRECVDNCVQRRIRNPERPRYGIPFGTDCQEWSDDVLLQCQYECTGK